MSAVSPQDRRALRSVAIQFFVNGAVLGSVLARFPEVRDQVGLTLSGFGLVSTLAGGAGLIGSLIASTIIGRFGTRRTLVVGALAQTLVLITVGFATTPVMLWAALATMAVIDTPVDIAMNLQASWLSARRRVPVMNRIHGLWSLGTLVGGAVASQLASAGVGLRPHLVGASVVLIAILVYVAQGLLVEDEQPTREPTIKPGARPRSMRTAWALFALAGAGAIAVEFVPNDWAALRLSEDLGVGAGAAGLGFVALTVGMTVGRFAGDAQLAVLGRERTFQLAVALAAGGLALASFSDTPGAVYAGFVIAGLGVSTFFPTLYDDAAQFPGPRGAALGAMTAGSRAATLTTPVLVGTLSDTSWSIGTSVGVVTLVSLAAVVIARRAL